MKFRIIVCYFLLYLYSKLDIKSIFAFEEMNSGYFYLKLRNKFITCGYNREIEDGLWLTSTHFANHISNHSSEKGRHMKCLYL